MSINYNDGYDWSIKYNFCLVANDDSDRDVTLFRNVFYNEGKLI